MCWARAVVGVATALWLLTGAVARAQEAEAGDDASGADRGSPTDRHAGHGLVLGLKVGGGVGLGAFGATPVVEAELGYMLPFPQPVGRSLELFVDAQYMAPSTDGTSSETDPRLPGDGVLRYEVEAQALPLTFGLLYRLPLPVELLAIYAGAGVRVHMQRITTSGTAGGESLGKNEETSTDVGAYFAVGADFFLGPGAVLAELQIAQASLDGYVMRDTNASSLNLAVGYRLML